MSSGFPNDRQSCKQASHSNADVHDGALALALSAGCRLSSICVGSCCHKPDLFWQHGCKAYKQVHTIAIHFTAALTSAELPRHMSAICIHQQLTVSSLACLLMLLYELFTYLQVVPEQLVIELGDLELVGLLPVHDPGAALALRVNQHRVSGGSGHHDAILNTQVISGQPLQQQR